MVFSSAKAANGRSVAVITSLSRGPWRIALILLVNNV